MCGGGKGFCECEKSCSSTNRDRERGSPVWFMALSTPTPTIEKKLNGKEVESPLFGIRDARCVFDCFVFLTYALWCPLFFFWFV